LRNQNATLGQKSLAGIGIAGTIVPPLKGVKAATVVKDTSKMFNPHQAALINLAKQGDKAGVTDKEADILLEWAEEYNVRGVDHRGTNHWVGGDHIKIGPFRHIPIK
jgi:hypothetical protein